MDTTPTMPMPIARSAFCARPFMMYTAFAQARWEQEHRDTFATHLDRLNTLLTVAATENTATIDQQVRNDIQELTAVVTQLQHEGWCLSNLSSAEASRRGAEIQAFVRSIETVEGLVADWKARMKPAKAVSRKRGRTVDDEDELPAEYKRYRDVAPTQDMAVEPAFCGPYADQYQRSVWWNEAVYE